MSAMMLTDVDGLAAAIPTGATVAVGGFQLSRVPVALLDAVVRAGARDLDVLCAPNPLALTILADGAALRRADCGFIGAQYEDGFVIPPALLRAFGAGGVELRQRDVYETIEQMRVAARAGRPRAAYALLHAQRADRRGNLQIDDPYADAVLAHGSARVLATVEALVDAVATPTIPAERVAGIAVAPRGALPAACFPLYDRLPEGVRARLGAAALALAGTRPADERPDAAPSTPTHDAIDAFVIRLARLVRDGEVVVTGLASAAAMLAIGVAQRTHAPRARYINCIGAVNPRLERGWPTSVEPALLAACEDTIDLPDIFDMARDGGVDAMFFGAAQIDGAANINLTGIGPAASPAVRFPGPAGSPSMRSFVRRVLIAVPRQSPRNLVRAVDAVTSAPSARNEETVLLTDHAEWSLSNGTFAPRQLSPGADGELLAAATGFAFATGAPAPAPAPNATELAALRDIDRDGARYSLLSGVRALGAPLTTNAEGAS